MPTAIPPQVDYTQLMATRWTPRSLARPLRLLAADPVAMFENDETWSAGSAVTSEPYVGLGEQSLLLQSVNAAWTHSTRSIAPAAAFDIAATPIFELLVHVDTAANLNTCTLYVCTGGSITKSIRAGMSTNVNVAHDGWNLVRVPIVSMTTAGGWANSDWLNVDYLRATIRSVAGTTVNVHFASARLVKPMPVLMLWSDDGFDDVEPMSDIAETYGMRYQHSIITGAVGGAGQATKAQLWDLHRRGHMMVNHTNGGTALDGMADHATRQAAIRAGRRWLIEHGFEQGANYFASPQGETTANVVAACRCEADGVTIAARPLCAFNRAASNVLYPGQFVYPLQMPYNLMSHYSLGMTGDVNLAGCIAKLQGAIDNGMAINLVTHKLDDGAAPVTSITTAMLKGLLRFAADERDAGRLEPMSVHDFWLATHPLIQTNGITANVNVNSTPALTATRWI